MLVRANSDGNATVGRELARSGSPITSVTAYPYNPVDKASATAIMYDTAGESNSSGAVPLVWSGSGGSDWGTPRSPFFAD
jgi:hypothetical protein